MPSALALDVLARSSLVTNPSHDGLVNPLPPFPPSFHPSLSPSLPLRHLTTNFLVAVAYVLAHAVLLFVHVITLFVAVNSADQALLTLLISNNFAEMKSSVFKRSGGR